MQPDGKIVAVGNFTSTGYQEYPGGPIDPRRPAGYIARFSANYAVAYDLNGGSGTTPASQSSTGESISLATGAGLSRLGYTFQGWNSEANGSGTAYAAGASFVPVGDTTLYAEWASTVSTITYDSNGGSAVAPATYLTGSSIALPPAPSRSGYVFGGWLLTDSDSSTHLLDAGANYAPVGSGPLTVVAQWTVSYRIAYDANGGTGSVPSGYFAVGAGNYRLASGAEIARPGYTLAGWNTRSDGSGVFYLADATIVPTADMTLYAQWSLAPAIVTAGSLANTGLEIALPIAAGGILLMAGLVIVGFFRKQPGH